MRSHRGQATVEYVAAVALLVCIFTGAAVAIAAPGVPRAVVGRLRLALCVVGGDVCTPEDAAARGLEPCRLTDEEHTDGTGIDVLFLHTGGTDTWTVGRRSDGTAVLSQSYGQDAKLSTGVGAERHQAGAGADASGGATFTKGRSWTMTEARLREVLRQTHGDPGKDRILLPLVLGTPDETYLEGGLAGSAELGAQAIMDLPGGEAEARVVLGRRRDAQGTTFYMDLGGAATGPITEALGTQVSGHAVAEWRTADPPVLTLRINGHSGEDESETVLRLPLRTAADRAAARRVAFLDLHDPAGPVRDLVARVRARGVIERLRYRTREDEHGWGYGAKLGVQLGVDHASSVLHRELVGADVLEGGLAARREDCLSGVRRS